MQQQGRELETEPNEQEAKDIEEIARELEKIEQEYRVKQIEAEAQEADLNSQEREELEDVEKSRVELAENKRKLESACPEAEEPPWITDARKRKVLNFLKQQAKKEELEEIAKQHSEP